MKQNKFRKLISILIFICLIGIGIKMVNASQTEVNLRTKYVANYFHAHKKGSNSFNKYGQLSTWENTSDSRKSYCIAPGESFDAKKTYTAYTMDDEGIIEAINSTQLVEDHKITQIQLDRIKLIAYYGYGYKDHNTTQYLAATQMLIWRLIDPSQVWTDINCTKGECKEISDEKAGVADEMREINTLIDNHSVRPRFNEEQLNLNIGESKTITDVNSVLPNYRVAECNNCTAQINGNDLTIIPTGIGNVSIKLEKDCTNYSSAMLVATNPESQNQIISGNIDPVIATINGSIIGGKVSITKTGDNGEKLSGVKFGVYSSNGNEVCNITTNEDGVGECGGLSVGHYTIKELNTIEGYVLNTTTYEFDITIENSNATLTIQNVKIKGTLDFTKTDFNNNNVLENALIEVYKETGEKVYSGRTNSAGKIQVDNLTYGRYYVVEKEAPEGYVLNEDKIYFEIKENGEIVQVTMDNGKIQGYIELYKVDKETGQKTQGDAILNGARYGIYKDGTKVSELITNSNGYAISDLLDYGEYVVKEIEPSTGYLLDTNEYRVTIKDNLATITVNSKEQVKKFDFHLLKVKGDGSSGVVETEANAEFNIYLKRTNEFIQKITTNSSGKASITLPYGKYKVCQIKGNDDTNDAPCFEINISSKDIEKVVNNELLNAKIKIVKVDSKTKKTIPIKGIKFKIKNLDTNEYVCQTMTYPNLTEVCVFETDENGILYTIESLKAGNYQLEELDQRINGYLWNKNPLKFEISKNSNLIYDEDIGTYIELNFENTEVLGKIIIHKKGEKFIVNNGFTYKEINLKDIEFGLYNLNGDLLSKVTTNSDGYAEFNNLKLGKYILKEIKTNNEYVINSKEYEINLEYKDQYTPVVEKEITLKNYLKKGTLEFMKEDFSTQKPLPNTLMTIYTINDEIVFEGKTNSDGKIIIPNLKCGKYYIVEKEPPVGYLVNEEKLYFEIKENGEIVKSTMKDEIIRGDLYFTKQDLSTSEPLPNTLIEIYTIDNKLIFRGKTNEDGVINIKRLKYGRYYILEKEAPEGYVLNSEKMYFSILENGKIVKCTMKDEKIKSLIKLNKVDNKGNILPGVMFNVYDINDNLIGEYETNENGIIQFELEYGKYYIKEIKTLEGYVLNEEPIYFDVINDGELIELEMTNQIITSKVKLVKKDNKENILLGVIFNVYDINDNLIGEYETNENGIIEFELEYGKYYIKEIKTLEGYVLNEEPIYFDVINDGELIELEMINKIISSKVKLHKINDSNEILPNVKIGVYDINDNLLGIYVTDENGDIELELEYGSYYFKELETIDGYKLNEDKIYFDILEDGSINQYILVNVPNTLNNDYSNIKYSALIIMAFGVIAYEIIKYKKQK